MEAGWSELPKDLLTLIANCLVTYTDQVRFTCVCTSWRSILPTILSSEVCSYPWLLLPRDDTNKKYEKFYSLHERMVHYLEVPEVLGKTFRGSSHSWLVSIEDSPTITLFNPFTRVQIALPPRYKFPDVRKYSAKKPDTEYALEPYDGQKDTYFEAASHVHNSFLDKLIPSSSPTSSRGNCMVAAIYRSHCNLAYCKLGDKKWTCIAKGMMGYDDAIFYEQTLYAVTFRSQVQVFDLSSRPKLIDTIEPPQKEGYPQRRYLVKTSIGLLQVQRHLNSTGADNVYRYRTSFFNIYRYEPSSRSWCKVENIGENVLFLGLNTSISIASSYLRGYKGNHIYFTDNFLDFHTFGVQGGSDIGVYDLDNRSVQSLPFYDIEKYWLWPTPIWYIHNPEDFIEQ